MKKKVLLSSIATIALCLCLIAGSTFALFTSKSENNIAVTAGKVEMIASVEDFKLYSVEAKADGTIVDENGGKYEYVERTDGKFINGGTAVLDGSMITLDKITPGDKISFGINGANNSDVSIQCRYIIQCAGDEALMKGLLVYINGVAYPALKSYTSAWTALEVGKSITDEKNIEIVVELPIKAGNEYQEKTTSINVLVEAVQGNADVDGSQATAQFLNGRVDLSDLTVTDTVANYGNVELVGGTVDVDDCGFENYGEATLTDMTLTAGSASDYGFRGIGSDSVTVLNDVEFVSGGGAIGAANGAEVTVNSGTYHVDSASTSGRYLIYTEGEGTKVVVNGGTYSWDKADNQKRAYVYAGVGTTVEINGGTFGKASTRSGYTAGILGDGSVIITGGTFGFDPTKWVAEGCKAVKEGSVWTVKPVAVTTAEELAELLTSDAKNIAVTLANDIDLPISALGNITAGSGEYKLGGANTDNIIIDLNGNKLNITTTYWSAIGANNDNATITIKNGSMTSTGNSAGTWNAYDVRLCNCNYVIENVTFDKAVAIDNAGKATTMKNVTINATGDVYALWITAEGQNVTIDGLTINSEGRGIKIDEQYVAAPEKVILNVSNATFNTVKKAAVIVKSAAGADITLDNVNIDNVKGDFTNAVWNDADSAASFDKITVVGGTIAQEN